MHIYLWQIAPLQSSIDALHSATPILAHLMADLYVYKTMHIYLCQIDPLQLSTDLYNTITPHKFPPPPIETITPNAFHI